MEKDFKTVSKLLFPEKKEFDKTPAQMFDDEIRRQVINIKKQR